MEQSTAPTCLYIDILIEENQYIILLISPFCPLLEGGQKPKKPLSCLISPPISVIT
jgi:hypothetical protein